MLLMTVTLAACDGDTHAPRDPLVSSGLTATILPSQQPRPSVIQERSRIPVVKVENVVVKEVPAAKVITVTLKANGATDGVRLDVRTRWDSSPPNSFPLGGLRFGDTRSVDVPVAYVEDGNYPIGLTILATPTARETSAGVELIPGGATMWWILWRNGAIREVLQHLPVRRKDGTIDHEMTVGPLPKSTVSTFTCLPDDPECHPPLPPAPLVRGTLEYAPPGSEVMRPLRRVQVKLIGNGQQFGSTVYTDNNGAFVINWCPGPNVEVTLQGLTENGDIELRGRQQGQWSKQVVSKLIRTPQCDSSLVVAAQEGMQSEVFDAGLRIVDASRLFWGSEGTRGKIKIDFDWNITPQGGFYSLVEDKILVNFTTFGTDLSGLLAHEYGHAVHQHALGQIIGTPCSNHYVGVPSTMACAWIEGLADFQASMTDPTGTGGTSGFLPPEFESNVFWGSVGAPGPDGSVTEGVVAAFLRDLVDGTGADGVVNASPSGFSDDVTVPTAFLAREIKSCEVSYYDATFNITTWNRVDGVDVLIYCLEKVQSYKPDCPQTSKTTYYCSGNYYHTITPSSKSPLFPQRLGRYPVSWVSMNHCNGVSCYTPYSIQAMRRAFLSNLYGNTTNNGVWIIPPAP